MMSGLLLVLLAGALSAQGAPPAPPGIDARQDSAPLRLFLNLPAYRLEALRDSEPVATIRVAIGSREYRTPIGRFQVTHLTWNPWWYPPARDWARHDTITPPCPANPMGVVKLGFGNGYFIHGTPKPATVGNAASHGCVRAANGDAQALAELIVAQVQPDALPAVRAWAASAVTRELPLRTPVPLDIRYELAEVRADSLLLYPDVYRRSPATAARALIAMRALVRAGVNPDRVETAKLTDLIARSRRGPVSIAVIDLLQPPLVTVRPLTLPSGGMP